ncbi:MAG TPA: DUF3891 family protein [Solirubrobacterales bacterium]|jgi:hypothetical protein|nr:DUF3891 family protein [Solirubrobacterales bacterium]
MIVSKRENGFTFVPQYEHGALAGELAARWGNERFAAPALAPALRIAAAHHDDGWRELDDLPAYNSEAGRPAHFLELPLERTVPPYGRGVDSVFAREPLAGALVAMHWTGLYWGRWGLQGSEPLAHPLAEEVVAERERQRVETLLAVWRRVGGLRSEFEAQVWHAYEVLQALDVISLALSSLDPSRPTAAGEPVAVPSVLGAIEQPPGPRLVPDAPTAPLGQRLDLTLVVVEPGVGTIDPWPFAAERLELALPARALPGDGLPEAEGVAAYRAAPVTPLAWTLVPGAR